MSGTVLHKHRSINPATATPRKDDVDGANWLEEHMFTAPEIGSVLVGDPLQSDGVTWIAPGGFPKVLTTHGEGALPAWEEAALAGAHGMLSATDFGTVVATLIRGDLLVANAAPAWARLPIGANGAVVRSNGLDAIWSDTLPGLKLSGIAVGSITYIGAANALLGDPALVWDAANKIVVLGIGATPGVGIADAVKIGVVDIGGVNTAGLAVLDEPGAVLKFGSGATGETWLQITDPGLIQSFRIALTTTRADLWTAQDLTVRIGQNNLARFGVAPGGNIIVGADLSVGASAAGVLYIDSGTAP